MQVQGPLRVTGTPTAGGSVRVEVACNETTVEIGVVGARDVRTVTVGPDGIAEVPIPDVPSGTTLVLSVGRGARRHLVVLTVP